MSWDNSLQSGPVIDNECYFAMNVILFLFSFILLSLSAICQARMLKIKGKVDGFLSCLILTAANLVGTSLILSGLSSISPEGYLIAHTLTALVSFAGFTISGRKVSSVDAVQYSPELPLHRDDGPPEKLVTCFFFVIVIVALVNLWLAVYVPPNTYDSMTYHLSRVGHWLQNGSLHHYFTQENRQLFMAPNAEILILWSVVFLKSDVLANVVQWLSYCGVGLLIYQIAGLLGFARRSSLFSALTYLSLPAVVLQSSSTQNDLVVTFFTLSFFYFFHSGIRRKNVRRLLLSGISCGLAVGTKGTIFYMVPALAAATIILAITRKAEPLRMASWGGFCLAGILLFGSYNYIQNYESFANPLAPEEEFEVQNGDKNLEKLVLNAARYGFQAVEFTGLPGDLVSKLTSWKRVLGEKYLEKSLFHEKYSVGLGMDGQIAYAHHEDTSWFGFIGFFVIFPISMVYLFRCLSLKVPDEKWIYSFIAFFFFILFCYERRHTPWMSRYFLLSIAFIAPLIGSVASLKNKAVRFTVTLMTILIASHAALVVTFVNAKKPITGEQTVFNTDFSIKRAVFGGAPTMLPLIQFIEEMSIPGSRIGHVVGENTWEYPLFGRDFSRMVIPVPPAEFNDNRRLSRWQTVVMGGEAEVMEKYNLDLLIVAVEPGYEGHSTDPIFFHNNPEYKLRVIPRKGQE